MKKIIYGETGTGKSYGPVAEYIRNHEGLIVISPVNIDIQLHYANLERDVFEKNTIAVYNLGDIPTAMQDDEFVKLINSEEMQSLSKNEDYTILIWGGFMYALNDPEVERTLKEMNCNVLIEYCCSQMVIERKEELAPYLKHCQTWELVQHCREKEDY